jgi:hypothetical protein
MKPTSHNSGTNGRSDVSETLSRRFPVTDCSYQSVTLDGFRGGCAKTSTPSFRKISSEYFENEARRSFVTEAAFFAMMVATTIGPVLQSARAMTHLVRAFAGV